MKSCRALCSARRISHHSRMHLQDNARKVDQIFRSSKSRLNSGQRSEHRLRRSTFDVSLPLPLTSARYAQICLTDREVVLDSNLLPAVAISPLLAFSRAFHLDILDTSPSKKVQECPKMTVTIDDMVTIDVTEASRISILDTSQSNFSPQILSTVKPIDRAQTASSAYQALIRRAMVSTLRDTLRLRMMADILRIEHSLEETMTLCAHAWANDAIFVTSDEHFFRTFGASLRAFNCAFEYLTVLASDTSPRNPPLYLAPQSLTVLHRSSSFLHRVVTHSSSLPKRLTRWGTMKSFQSPAVQDGNVGHSTMVSLPTISPSAPKLPKLPMDESVDFNEFTGAGKSDARYHYLSPRLARGKAQSMNFRQQSASPLRRQCSVDSFVPKMSARNEKMACLPQERHTRSASSMDVRESQYLQPPKNSHLMEFILF